MIKSKIDARERALELAILQGKNSGMNFSVGVEILPIAKAFAEYLIGDANLPEVTDDAAHIKELFDIANKEMNKVRQQDNSGIEQPKTL